MVSKILVLPSGATATTLVFSVAFFAALPPFFCFFVEGVAEDISMGSSAVAAAFSHAFSFAVYPFQNLATCGYFCSSTDRRDSLRPSYNTRLRRINAFIVHLHETFQRLTITQIGSDRYRNIFFFTTTSSKFRKAHVKKCAYGSSSCGFLCRESSKIMLATFSKKISHFASADNCSSLLESFVSASNGANITPALHRSLTMSIIVKVHSKVAEEAS